MVGPWFKKGVWGYILGLYWDNGKENGNYYIRVILGLNTRATCLIVGIRIVMALTLMGLTRNLETL